MWLSLTTSTRPTAFAARAAQSPSATAQVVSTLTALPGGVVDGGEIVLLAIKPSMWRPLFESAPWLIVAGLLAGVLGWLAVPLPGMSLLLSVQLVLMVGVAHLCVALLRWVPSWHVLTDRRIIDIEGVREPRIRSLPLIEVRNTYMHESALERLAGLGTVLLVSTDAKSVPHAWRSINHAEAVHARVRRAIEHAIDQHSMPMS